MDPNANSEPQNQNNPAPSLPPAPLAQPVPPPQVPVTQAPVGAVPPSSAGGQISQVASPNAQDVPSYGVPQPNNPSFAYGQGPVPPQSGKSLKKRFIAIALVVVGLVIVGIGMIFALFAMPAIQSKATATKFMTAMVAGDVGTAVKLSGSADDNSFLTNASDKVKGNTFKLSEAVYTAGKPSYYLFVLSGGEQKYARVGVKKSGGKFVVDSYVYNTSALRLIPGEVVQTKTTNTTTEPTSTASTQKCFAPDDYSAALGYKNTISFSAQAPRTANVHFKPDSLEYAASSEQGYIDEFAAMATTNPGKDYSVHVYGSVATTSAGDAAFANQRAEKIKSALVAQGMSAAKITVDAPKNISDMGMGTTNTTVQEMSRVVVMSFAPGCVAGDTSTSSGR